VNFSAVRMPTQKRKPLGTNPGRIGWSEAKQIRRKILRDYRRLAERLKGDIEAIEDSELRFTVAVLVEALSDEDDIASIEIEPLRETSFRFHRVILDNDICVALEAHHGDHVQAAAQWFADWMAKNPAPITWLGWVFGRVDIAGRRGEKLRVEVDHVVYDFAQRRTIGITLRDRDTMYTSALLPMEGSRA
jgi:hypothetical protein